YIEQDNIWKQLNPNVSARMDPNIQFAGTVVKTYVCPSDPLGTEVRTAWPNMWASQYFPNGTKTVPTSYMMSGFVWDCAINGKAPGGSCLSPGGLGFAPDSPKNDGNNIYGEGWNTGLEKPWRRIADIKDGTSNTLAVSESLPDCNQWSQWFYG